MPKTRRPSTGLPADPGPDPAPPAGGAAPADELAQLRARLDALEVAGQGTGRADRGRRGPWYTDAATLVAVLALVFSVGATVYTGREASRQDARAARAQLGQLVQRLSALPKENAELVAKYEDDRATQVGLSGYITSESLVLSQQAADLVDRIPDQVSQPEYLAVALALEGALLYPRALTVIDRGLRLDDRGDSRVALLRVEARILFRTGAVASGRRRLEEALRAGDPTSPTGMRGIAYTEVAWAGLEDEAGNCPQARTHLERAARAAAAVRVGPFRREVLRNVAATSLGCVPRRDGPSPPTVTPVTAAQ